MASVYVRIPPTGGSGPGAGVDSYNGRSGPVVSQAGDYSAALVSFTPAGSISATDVQAAIEELDAEKQDFLGTINSDTGGLLQSLAIQPNNESGSFVINNISADIEPISNSPNLQVQAHSTYVNLDSLNSGNTLGTNGTAVKVHNNTINHQNTGAVGDLAFHNNYFNLGNGTDPLTVKGISYSYGFGNLSSGVTVTDNIQGYGFQFNAAAGSSLNNIIGFYDFATITGSVNGYNSYIASPTIAEIQNGNNYSGFQNNAQIANLDGNAGYIGMGIFPTIGAMGTGNFKGMEIGPNITNGSNITGLSIYMDNCVGTNVKAMEISGDVSINGALSFTGALSIGQLQAFYSSNPIESLDGNPQAMHGLVTEMVALDGVTTTDADVIGVNTAMLIRLEEDSVTTSGALGLGFAALALPCVVETLTNSSLDFMNCAVYALNLSGTSTGGTIDTVNLCRTVAIPNGITTINELRAFEFDLPFGDVGTDIWGLHLSPTSAQNFIGGSLNIGSVTEKVSNSDVALEIGNLKAFLNARLTSTERDALTAIDGMQIYNTTTSKLQVRAAGSWVDLH